MSFRSRTRPTQPVVRRRSLSSSRPSNTNGSYTPSYYNSSSNSGYSSRPLSTGYYPSSTGQSTGSTGYYQSPYTNSYTGSRDNIYNSHSSSSPRNGYTNRRDLNSNYSKGYDTVSRYSGNTYNSDRYISPYSNYDNGITTAGLSLSMTAPSSYNKTSNNDYTKSSSSSNRNPLLKSKSMSISNNNLNSYSSNNNNNSKTSVGTNTPTLTTVVTRSQSLRDQERKSRTRSRSRSAAQRSISASSEKSEGYESGNERSSRTRLGSSTSSLADTENNDKKTIGKDTTENGEIIDYKALWEAVKLDNDKLKKQLKGKDEELSTAKSTIDRFTNATTKNSLSELEKRERRAMERKLSEMEEELKQLDILKTENQRLKEENGALIRVISKLSK